MIRCGHCSTREKKSYHDTIAQVRLCSQKQARAKAEKATPAKKRKKVAKK